MGRGRGDLRGVLRGGALARLEQCLARGGPASQPRLARLVATPVLGRARGARRRRREAGAWHQPYAVHRTGCDAEFAAGTMTKVVQQTATWDEATAKQIVESVINAKEEFNVIYAENDGMAKGAVAALDEL